jgi:hypothetical protein
MSHIAKIRGIVLDSSNTGKPRIKLTMERINEFARDYADSGVMTLHITKAHQYWAAEFANLKGKYIEVEIKLIQLTAFGRSDWRALFTNMFFMHQEPPSNNI